MEDTAVAPAGTASSSSRAEPPPRRRRQVPLAVWALTALHAGLLLVFSVLYPPFAGFDETQHVDAVLSIRHGDGWPAPQERELSQGVVAAATPVLGALQAPPFSDDDLQPRDERPSFAALGVERDSVGQPLPNQMTQHPPLYYAVGAAVLAAVPGSVDWPFDRTVGVLRLLSVLLLTPLPLLAWATARALGGGTAVGLTAAALPLSVPQLHRVGGNVNNDALYTLLFAVSVLLLVRLAKGDLRRRTVLASGVVVGLALLTKGFALVLPIALALAIVQGARTAGDRSWWRWALFGETVAFAVGGWWWLRNLLLYDTLQPKGWPQDVYRQLERLVPRPAGTPAPVDTFAGEAYELLSTRFWGGLGISYTGPPTYSHWLTDTLVVLTLVLLAVAVVRLSGRRRAALLLGVLAPFLGVLALVVYGIWQGYTSTLSYPGAQGRYLFGSLTGLSAGVALGLGSLAGRLRRALPVAAVVLALGMQAPAVLYVLRRYWLPPYEGQERAVRYEQALRGILEWAPWPPAVTLGMFATTATAAGVALLAAALAARSDGRRGQPV